MKHLWQKIQETDAIIWIAWAVGILFLGGVIFMSQGCELVRSLTGTASVAHDTVKSIDTDGSGVISMQEIIQYCFAGWVAGRATETAGKLGVKKIRNGRKRNDRATPASSDS